MIYRADWKSESQYKELKGSTVGDLLDYLSQFDHDTKVEIVEIRTCGYEAYGEEVALTEDSIDYYEPQKILVLGEK